MEPPILCSRCQAEIEAEANPNEELPFWKQFIPKLIDCSVKTQISLHYGGDPAWEPFVRERITKMVNEFQPSGKSLEEVIADSRRRIDVLKQQHADILQSGNSST